MIYLRARWYDPVSGRFLRRDPAIGDPLTPASLNAYSYANASALVLADPYGLWTIAICAQASLSVGIRASYQVCPIMIGDNGDFAGLDERYTRGCSPRGPCPTPARS